MMELPFYTRAELSSALGLTEELSSAYTPCASKNEITHIKRGSSEAQQRGVMSMRRKIEIHDDYCHDMDSAEIESILTQITALITDAVLRVVYQSENAA